MKDIESQLKDHAAQPKRALHDNFTPSLIAELKAQPKQSRWASWSRLLQAQHMSRAALAAITGVVLISGTAAALTFWPKPTVTTTTTKELPSGNHIVGVNATDCNYFDSPSGAPASQNIYYEVRQGSKLTDEQIRSSLEGMCEDDQSNNAVNQLVNKYGYGKLSGMESTMTYTVNAVANGTITVSLDSHYDAKQYTLQPNMTYTHFSSNLVVQEEDTPVSFSSLHAGDSVKMIVQDTSGRSSETQDNWNPLTHPDTIQILAIIKTPPLTGDPGIAETAFATDMVRLDPCTVSPTGFCRAYEFAQPVQK